MPVYVGGGGVLEFLLLFEVLLFSFHTSFISLVSNNGFSSDKQLTHSVFNEVHK